MKYILGGAVLLMGVVSAFADMGINYPSVTDSPNEYNAKAGADSLGITTVYDHPTQAPNGQFYVPVEYNRPGDPAAGEQDPNAPHNTTDIDYIPLAQLKGAQGAAGASGAAGSKGDVGATGQNGKDGRDGTDATIDNHLFLNVGLDIRWYDWKYVSLNSGYRYDVRHFNHTVDMAVVQIKLGRSHEQRELDKLRKEVESLSFQHMALLDR